MLEGRAINGRDLSGGLVEVRCGMTASVYHLTGPRALELREEPLGGGLLTPAEIEAVTVYTAISPGTELAAWEGKPPLRPSSPYPRLLGYCNLARVTRVGSEVAGMGAGNYVLTHQSHRSAFRAPVRECAVIRYGEPTQKRTSG